MTVTSTTSTTAPTSTPAPAAPGKPAAAPTVASQPTIPAPAQPGPTKPVTKPRSKGKGKPPTKPVTKPQGKPAGKGKGKPAASPRYTAKALPGVSVCALLRWLGKQGWHHSEAEHALKKLGLSAVSIHTVKTQLQQGKKASPSSTWGEPATVPADVRDKLKALRAEAKAAE